MTAHTAVPAEVIAAISNTLLRRFPALEIRTDAEHGVIFGVRETFAPGPWHYTTLRHPYHVRAGQGGALGQSILRELEQTIWQRSKESL